MSKKSGKAYPPGLVIMPRITPGYEEKAEKKYQKISKIKWKNYRNILLQGI